MTAQDYYVLHYATFALVACFIFLNMAIPIFFRRDDIPLWKCWPFWNSISGPARSEYRSMLTRNGQIAEKLLLKIGIYILFPLVIFTLLLPRFWPWKQ